MWDCEGVRFDLYHVTVKGLEIVLNEGKEQNPCKKKIQKGYKTFCSINSELCSGYLTDSYISLSIQSVNEFRKPAI